MTAMSLKLCVAVTVLKGQFLNEVEFMLNMSLKWCITFHLGHLATLLFVVTYVFTLLSLCIHYNDIHYVIIDIWLSEWFCIREVLGLNLCYNSGCVDFCSHSAIRELQAGECWLISNPFRLLFQYWRLSLCGAIYSWLLSDSVAN